MPPKTTLFTSARERRLWLGALAALAAIYSTLALAGTLVARLQEWSLLPTAVLALMLISAAAVVGSGLKRRPGRREAWTALAIGAVYGMAVLRMGATAAERTHLFEYGILAVLIRHALLERSRNGRRVRAPSAIAIAVTILIGWLDEGIQALVPGRVYDVFDVLTNAIAAVVAVAASLAVEWALGVVGRFRGRDDGTRS